MTDIFKYYNDCWIQLLSNSSHYSIEDQTLEIRKQNHLAEKKYKTKRSSVCRTQKFAYKKSLLKNKKTLFMIATTL